VHTRCRANNGVIVSKHEAKREEDMKKANLIISVFVGLVAIFSIILVSNFLYKCFELLEHPKSFIIEIEEDEMVDYNAVDQEKYNEHGIRRHWFDTFRETEREKLASYMKENNYKIVPGTYQLSYGYDFIDLLRELQFEEITQTEESDTPRLTSDTPGNNIQSLPCSSPSK
jgi:hypothetical protein